MGHGSLFTALRSPFGFWAAAAGLPEGTFEWNSRCIFLQESLLRDISRDLVRRTWLSLPRISRLEVLAKAGLLSTSAWCLEDRVLELPSLKLSSSYGCRGVAVPSALLPSASKPLKFSP